MFIKKIARLIVALNSNVSRGQIAAGMATGLLLALVPSGNLLWIALFFVSFILRNIFFSSSFKLLEIFSFKYS